MQIALRITRLSVGDRFGADIESNDDRRFTRKQCAAVAFPACGVENDPSVCELRDGAIAMPVLVPYRAATFRGEAFAGENERCGGSGRGIQSGG